MTNIQLILEENKKLKEENQKLKDILKSNGYYYLDENILLNRNDRLRIYMDYFKGRTDVYPYKYFNKKLNKDSFAAFNCFNKFNYSCPITKGKMCNSNCSFYSPIPLTKEIIYNHLSQSKKAIGLYPILDDNTCYFLAIDFDDDYWFENLLSVYRSANKHGISCLMERSQSGNGGHLWFFFDKPIRASLARDLGDFLINDAMNNNKALNFKAFDRMFPNQDYLSNKGFGNFIALPLQCDALQQGNSIFINEYGQPIKKSYHHLLATPKVKEEQITQLLDTEKNTFKNYFSFNESLNTCLIDKPLEIIENSMIHISKKGLSAKDLNSIRKLSSTYNPKFFENQKLHISNYNTPRVLSEFIEDDKIISIPRGLKQKFLKIINTNLMTYKKEVQTGKDIDISFKGALRIDQQIAADLLTQNEIAILEAVPGFGKTIIALNIMATLQLSTLIIVQSKDLLNQWKSQIDEFIEYPKFKQKKDHFIGEFNGSKKKLKYNIDIALIQSLSNISDYSALENYGLILIDECHHASNDTYRRVLRNIKAKYIYSFTATPKRKDKTDKITYMYLGNIAYKTDKKEMIHNRSFNQILMPRITTFKTISIDKTFTEISNELYKNNKRNYFIISDVQKEVKNEKNIIILTDRKEHINILYNMLQYENYDIYRMSGETPAKERTLIKEKLLISNKYILIATSQLIGEGFDLPSLNVMFITMPLSFEGRLIQYIGRLHREYQNKTDVIVYDYVDNNIKMLQNSFQNRLKTYKKEGYKIIDNNKITEFDKVIFNKSNYEYHLNSSMRSAKNSIHIFVNDCKLNRIQKLYSYFIDLISKGIKMYIIINKEYDNTVLSYLDGISTKIFKTTSNINGILIDEKEIWSSNCSYLGTQHKDLYYIKTIDSYIIDEIKETINNSINI